MGNLKPDNQSKDPEQRERLRQAVIEESVPEDPDKGRKLKGFLESKLIPAAIGDSNKEALGKLTVYGFPFEFDIKVKEEGKEGRGRSGKPHLLRYKLYILTYLMDKRSFP